jgi:hypothetical protein
LAGPCRSAKSKCREHYIHARENSMQKILAVVAITAALLTVGELRAQETCQQCGGAVGGQGAGCGHGGGLGAACGKFSLKSRGDVWAQYNAARRPWHGQYYYLQYGQPTALVVPPTAVMHQNYSWGVSQNTMMPTYHQFGPAAYPSAGGAFYGTPLWPSHTDQFGVYPVRAPW